MRLFGAIWYDGAFSSIHGGGDIIFWYVAGRK